VNRWDREYTYVYNIMAKYPSYIKVIVISLFLFSFFTNTKAETVKGYSVLESMSEDSLIYKPLENSESYSDIKTCYDKIQLTRYPEILTTLSKQAVCFDKYAIAGELRAKLVETNTSLEKLNLYKKITELTLNNAIKIDNAIKSGNVNKYSKLQFVAIPKGELVDSKIQKEIKHKPQCKIDSLASSKIPVQSCENKEVIFSIFTENTRGQIIRLKNNFSDLQEIFNKSENGEFGTIETVRLLLKANSLANDSVLLDSESFNIASNNLSSVNNTATFLEITVSDNNQVNYDKDKNPSGKVLDTIVRYPTFDSNLNIIGQKSMNFPQMYLETFKKDVIPKILVKLRDRITEYNQIIIDFSKNQKTLMTSLSTIEKDSACYNNINPDKSITMSAADNDQRSNLDQNINLFEKQTIISFIGDIFDRTVSGVKSTFSSISETTKQFVTITTSPTPTPGIYAIVKPDIDQSSTESYPGSASFNPKVTITNISPAVTKTSPSPSPKPSSTPVFTSTPTPTPTSSPTPRITYSPSPTPSPYYSPVSTIYNTPSPTPKSSSFATPTPTPTPTSSPSYSLYISPIITSPTPTPSTSPTSMIDQKSLNASIWIIIRELLFGHQSEGNPSL